MRITQQKLIPTAWEVRLVQYGDDTPPADSVVLRGAIDGCVRLCRSWAMRSGQWAADVYLLDTCVEDQLFSELVASGDNTLRVVSWEPDVAARGPLASAMSSGQLAAVRRLVLTGTMWHGTFATPFAPSYTTRKHAGSGPPR